MKNFARMLLIASVPLACVPTLHAVKKSPHTVYVGSNAQKLLQEHPTPQGAQAVLITNTLMDDTGAGVAITVDAYAHDFSVTVPADKLERPKLSAKIPYQQKALFILAPLAEDGTEWALKPWMQLPDRRFPLISEREVRGHESLLAQDPFIFIGTLPKDAHGRINITLKKRTCRSNKPNVCQAQIENN